MYRPAYFSGAVRPLDPLRVVSGVDEQCVRGRVWQSDLCLVGLGVGKRMLPRPADGAPSPWLGVCPGSSAVCRLYRSPGAPPPDPCPSLPRFPLLRVHRARSPHTALPDPPTTGQGKTRPCPAVTAPGSPGQHRPTEVSAPPPPPNHPDTPAKPQVRAYKRVTSITRKAPDKHQQNIEKASKQM